MTTRPEIPGHDQFVSRVELLDSVLTIRFVTDIDHPGMPEAAYSLKVFGAKDPESGAAFLQRAWNEKVVVYPAWAGDCLLIATEAGGEFLICAESFEGGEVELDVNEVKASRDRVYEWYELETAATGRLRERLQRVVELLLDQRSRIEAKRAGHLPDSAAGVVYAQHLAFVERLLREAEV